MIYVEYESISTRQDYEKQNLNKSMTASYTLYILQGEDIKTCSMFDDGPRLSVVLPVKNSSDTTLSMTTSSNL